MNGLVSGKQVPEGFASVTHGQFDVLESGLGSDFVPVFVVYRVTLHELEDGGGISRNKVAAYMILNLPRIFFRNRFVMLEFLKVDEGGASPAEGKELFRLADLIFQCSRQAAHCAF